MTHRILGCVVKIAAGVIESGSRGMVCRRSAGDEKDRDLHRLIAEDCTQVQEAAA